MTNFLPAADSQEGTYNHTLYNNENNARTMIKIV